MDGIRLWGGNLGVAEKEKDRELGGKVFEVTVWSGGKDARVSDKGGNTKGEVKRQGRKEGVVREKVGGGRRKRAGKRMLGGDKSKI